MVRALLLAMLVAGSAMAQTVPVYTTDGRPSRPGDPISLGQTTTFIGAKQDFVGTIALNTFAAGGRLPCTGLDDTAALGLALATAVAQGGGTVELPAGSCQTAMMIALPAKVRLVGQGARTQITPTASMAAVVQVTGGQSSIENLALQQSGTFAAAGVQIAKGDGNVLPVELHQITVIGFPKGVRYVSGDTVRVFGGFFLNNGVAFSFEPVTFSTVNHTIAGGTLVQGGSGIDLPANLTGSTYPHVEGLLVSDMQLFQGVDNGFCLRVAAGVHIVWRGGICGEARTGGYGFRFIKTVDAIRSVDIGDVFIGANPNAAGTLNGISVAAPVSAMKLHGLHFSSWKGTPIAIDTTSSIPTVVDLSQVSFDGTLAANDITVARATIRIVQPQYDVSVGIAVGTAGAMTSWP